MSDAVAWQSMRGGLIKLSRVRRKSDPRQELRGVRQSTTLSASTSAGVVWHSR